MLASRTNTMFSLPMLFMMGGASHLPLAMNPETSCSLLCLILAAIIGALELNAIKGKLGPLATIKGVVHCGIGLTVGLYVVIAALA